MLLSILSNIVMIPAAPLLPYYPLVCDDTGIIALDETECLEEIAELTQICLTIQSGKLTVCQSVTAQSEPSGQVQVVEKGTCKVIIATSSNSKNNIIFTYGL